MGLLKTETISSAVASGITGTYNAILDQGCEFEGKLTFDGTVRIDGVFRGEVVSDSTLVVGESGKVEANIKVRKIVISGEVHGDVEATEKVELLAPGVLRGNIKTPSLVIEDGVVFDGSCHMATSATHKPKQSEKSDKKDDGSKPYIVSNNP